MNLQKINWKLFFKDPTVAKPDDFFRVFNSWIPDSPEIFIDVADYQHVHDGPLTVLIGHFVDYALDETDRRRGFLYGCKKTLEGDEEERLRTTLSSLLKAADRLVSDSLFGGKLHFLTNELEFTVNDRALAPNTSETFTALSPQLNKVMKNLYGEGNYQLNHLKNPKRRFSVRITSTKTFSLPELLQKI